MDDGSLKQKLEAHRSDIMSLAPLPGTSLMASGSAGGRLFLWDIEAGTVSRLEVYEHSVLTMTGECTQAAVCFTASLHACRA